MSEARRKRLESVLHPLVDLDEFSGAEAKKRCSDASPAYVTRTLGQLVRDGVLCCREDACQRRYRWALRPRVEFQVDAWIDRQIYGTQLCQTPIDEHPRERLLRDGAAALSTSDLLAVLIRVGVPDESAVVGAKRIANRFAERIDALPKCSAADLRAISPAATPSGFSQIMAGIELGRRVAIAESDRSKASPCIHSTSDAIEYCRSAFARLAADALKEEFHIVTLDTKHRPLQRHQITVGTLDASLVHPREVFRPAIRDAAAAVLLVHNHPSGDPEPSREDRQVTRQLTDAGNLLGIQVLDHIIVAREGCLSIRECA